MYRFRTDRLHRDNSKRQLQGKQKTVFLYCRFYFILFFWVGFFGELWLIDLWTHSEVVLPSYFIDVYTRVSRYTRVFYNRKNTLLYCTKNICLVHVFPFQAACLIRPYVHALSETHRYLNSIFVIVWLSCQLCSNRSVRLRVILEIKLRNSTVTWRLYTYTLYKIYNVRFES